MKRGRVLVTRPEGQAAATMAALAARGFDCVAAPATVFENLPGPPLDLGIAGIAVTSANGVAALAARTARRDLPLFAVGEATGLPPLALPASPPSRPRPATELRSPG